MTDAPGDVVEGDVVRRRIGVGSKSERDAVVVDTPDRSFVLRRRGGNAFADPALDALVGQRVRLEGLAADTTFLIDRFDIVDQSGEAHRSTKRPRRADASGGDATTR
jgi:hypothetical protein